MSRRRSKQYTKCPRFNYGHLCVVISGLGICSIVIAVNQISPRFKITRTANDESRSSLFYHYVGPDLMPYGTAQTSQTSDKFGDNFTVRFAVQEKTCSEAQKVQYLTATNLAHFQYIGKHNLFYCGIEKVGSTFWRRVFQHLHSGVVASPYQIKPQDCMKNYKSLENTNNDSVSNIIKSSYKFLFVRDPYSRLLSGYVDKLYSPNPYYWNTLGKHIINKYRNKSTLTAKSKQCGHDVTFPELIDYVIGAETSGEHRDGHFMPGSDICQPCLVHYDSIGKMETFAKDTFQILRKANLTDYLKPLDTLSNDSIDDTIYDISQAYISMRPYAGCLDPQTAILRVWKKLQFRGIIHYNIPCPACLKKSKLPNERELLRIIKEANSKNTKQSLRLQKEAMFIDAYRQIPLKTMKKLAEVFKNDFDIFHYNPYPEILFNPKLRVTKPVDVFRIYL